MKEVAGPSRGVPQAAALFLLALGISQVIYGADRVSFGVLVPHILKAFSLSSAVAAGTAATIFLLGQAAVLLFAGWLCDRWGRKQVMIIGMVLFSIAVLGSGLSRTFGELIVMRLLTGVGEGFFLPAAVSIAGAAFARNRGAAVGFVDATFSLGLIAGPILTAALVGNDVSGWRSPLVVFGVVGLGLAIVVQLLMDSSRANARIHGAESTAADEVSQRRPSSASEHSARRFIGAATVMYLLWGLAFWPFLGLAPTFLIKVQHFPLAAAAAAATAGGIGVLLLSVPLGALADRIGRLQVIAASALLVAGGAALFFNLSMTTTLAAVLYFVVEGVGIGALFTNLTAFTQDIAPQGHLGTSIGFVYTFVYVLAAFSGPIFGAVVGGMGWRWASTIVIVAPMLCLAVFALGTAKMIRPGLLVQSRS